MTHRSTNLACAALAVAVTLATPLAANQVGSNEPIDMSLEDAALTDVLQSFSAIAGARLDIAPDLEGRVTIELAAVRWVKALHQICRDHELYCTVVGGEPPTLRVRRAGELPAGYAEPINMSLAGADLREVLTLFGQLADIDVQIGDAVQGEVRVEFQGTPWPFVLKEVCRLAACRVVWGEHTLFIEASTDDAPNLNMSLKQADLERTLRLIASLEILGESEIDVEIDRQVTGTVTADLERVTWPQALDVICEPLGCLWKVVYGDPPVLRIEPPKSRQAAAPPGTEEPAAAAKKVAFRFAPPSGPPVDGTAAFTWAEPIHVLASDGPYRARLSWIPFGPELSVLLPVIERCGRDRASVSVLDPIVLPLEREVRHLIDGAVLDLGPAGVGAAVPGPSAKEASASCGPERRGEIRVSVARRAGEDGGPRPNRLQAVESYLLVRPVEARDPIAAVIALGGAPDGRWGLALVRPSAQGVEVETLSVALGERVERTVRSDGHAYQLSVEYVGRD